MSVISKKNQLTLPVAALREAGLGPGDDVQVKVIAPGRIEVAKMTDVVAKYAGIFDETVYPEGYLKELRSEWD